MDNQLPEAFMIMKAGAHEGECLDCIRKRKERELLSKAKKISGATAETVFSPNGFSALQGSGTKSRDPLKC